MSGSEVKVEVGKVADEEPKGRSSQRDKRSPKVLDLSDLKDSSPPPKKNAVEKLKSKTDHSTLCGYCRRHENVAGEEEEFLVCPNCDVTMHSSCMDYTEEQAIRLRKKEWLCFHCKLCHICNQNMNVEGDGELLCDTCDKSYHFNCLQLPQRPRQKVWICDVCCFLEGN